MGRSMDRALEANRERQGFRTRRLEHEQAVAEAAEAEQRALREAALVALVQGRLARRRARRRARILEAAWYVVPAVALVAAAVIGRAC